MARKPAAPKFGKSIAAMLDALAACTDVPGEITRLYLSPSHKRAVDLVSGWMRDAGMSVQLDATATVIGRYDGTTANAPALLIGSHIDSVRNAGRFDGTLGVTAGIAVVAALHAEGKRLPFPVEIIAFGDEEGSRFTSTLGGSRALAGVFDMKMLDERDAEGISRREALLAFGCDLKKIPGAAREPGSIRGYVEMHIEQGPVLEAENRAVGVVTAINGATRGTVTLTGLAGHAGTVPMVLRQDALAAAAEIILAVEARGRSEPDLVATVGRCEVPGAATNTVPGRVTLSLDIRAPLDKQRKAAVKDISAAIQRIAKARNVKAAIGLPYDAPAAECDATLTQAMAAAVTRQGHDLRRLASGAGHDPMAFQGRIPFTMLFVRSKAGISHNAAEFTSTADIDAAARVLMDFVTNAG